MSFCAVFMVLLVTSKLTIGQTNVVPQIENFSDGDQQQQQQQQQEQLHQKHQIQQVTPEANTVATSTEVQGAQTRNEKKLSSNSNGKFDESKASSESSTQHSLAWSKSLRSTTTTTTTKTTTSSTKDPSSGNPPDSPGDEIHEVKDIEEKSTSNSRRRGSSTTHKVESTTLQATTQSTLSTTNRMVRNSSAPPGRDNKLMSLLAARRTALQRDRWRTHRRGSTTSKTSVETTSKAPSDPRTMCERNCTKNFTRRTTASCMRRCASLHKVHTTITPTQSTTSATNSSSQRTKVDEKDNNEILETDESSHGFFVVTKDLNDTVNHIGEEVKMTSADKSHRVRKIRPPTVAPASVEEADVAPYTYFGQKLPANKPTVLKISRVNDDHPRILEVSVPKQTDRTVLRQNFYKRRNLVAHTRRLGANNHAKPVVSTSTTKEELVPMKSLPDDGLVKDSSDLDNTTLNIFTRSTTNETVAPLVGSENETTPSEMNTIPQTEPTPATDYQTNTEPVPTPLLINVPDMEEIKESATEPVFPPQLVPRVAQLPPGFPPPPHHVEEEKKNLIVFLNVTTPRTTTTEALPLTTQTSTTQSTTVSTTPSTTTTTTAAATTTTTPTTTTPTTTTSTTPESPTTKSTSSTAPTAPRPTEGKSTTTTTTSPKPPAPPTLPATTEATTKSTQPSSTTTQLFTKTTISSSVRSTVNPRTSPATVLTTIPTKNTTLEDYDSFERVINETASIFLNFSTIFKGPPLIAAKNPNFGLDGFAMNSSEVTIEEHRINLATYVLAGFGILPILGIILYIVKTVIFKRLTKDEAVFEQYVPDGQPISPVHKMDKSDDCHEQYSIMSDQEFDRSNLRFKSLLGEGNFGQVWKAEADDLSGHLGTTRIVAVKTMRSGSTQSGLKEEGDIMRKLGSHPNVVTLLGTCLETEPHLLIMEYAMRGRLLSLLRAARSATNILPASVPGGRSLAPLSPRTLAGFCLDIARGMEYIAEKKIVHRDLAARNVLLDHNGVCKICDFGMSIDLEMDRKKQQSTRKIDFIRHHTNALENRFRFEFGGRLLHHWNEHHTKNNNHLNVTNNNNNNNNNNHEKKHHDSVGRRPALPIRWMAPEALQYHMFSTETDVWAFGIVLWEIATLGCTPYPTLSGREVVRNVPNGTRPDLPPEARPEFYDLMNRCWRKDPRQRPTFREARIEISRSLCSWVDDDTANSDYMDVSGFSEDLEHGMVYFNRRISEFECEI